MRLSRRAAAGLSPALQGGGEVPQVVVVGVGVERDGGPPGRTSMARMTLWLPDLEVGVASRPDLAGGCGGGGGSFGRHGVAGRRVASCGGMVGGRPPPPHLSGVFGVWRPSRRCDVPCLRRRGRAATGVGGRFGRMWGDVPAMTSSGGRSSE
jgi:hypothetical protein